MKTKIQQGCCAFFIFSSIFSSITCADIEISSEVMFIPENSTSNLYIRLTSAPTAPATVMVARISGDANITVDNGSTALVFSVTNWSNWKTAVIRHSSDADALDGTAVLSVSNEGMTIHEVLAVEHDDETLTDISSTLLFDLGKVDYPPPSNWNESVQGVCEDDYLFLDAIDTNEVNTGIDVFLIDRFNSTGDKGLVDESLYPSNATKDSFWFYYTQETNATLRFEDLPLEPSEFTLKLLGSCIDEGTARRMSVTIDSSNVIYNCVGNSATQAVFKHIPAVTNSFSAYFELYPGDYRAELSVFELNYTVPGQRPVVAPDPLTISEGSSNRVFVRLPQAVPSETTVSVSWAQGDTDIQIPGATQLIFNASNWNTHQQVWVNAGEDMDPINGQACLLLSMTSGVTAVKVMEDDNDPYKRIIIDFGPEGMDGNWNVVTEHLADTDPLIDNLVNTDGELSGLSLYITNDFGGGGYSSGAYYRYPDKATKDHLWVTPNENENNGGIAITGLHSSMIYSVILYGYGDQNYGKSHVKYEVEGIIQTLDCEDNTNQVVEYALVPSPPDKEIDIRVASIRGGNWKDFLSVMEILYVSTTTVVSAVTDTSTLYVTEGSTNNLGIRLSGRPFFTSTVQVTRVSGDTNLSVLAGETLVFSSSVWDAWQYATFSAEEDDDENAGYALYRVGIEGGSATTVTISEIDNDSPMVLVSTNRLTVNEGFSNVFGVKLSIAPVVDKTVTVGRVSGDTDLAIANGAQKVFTPMNWHMWQTVTVASAVDDDICNGIAEFDVVRLGIGQHTQKVTAVENDDDGYPQRVLFDITETYMESGFGWNNIQGTAPITFTNVVDTNGVPTKVDWVTVSGGQNGGMLNGMETAGYPESAWRDRWRTAADLDIQLRDIDPLSSYSMHIYASSDNAFDENSDIQICLGSEDPVVVSPYLNTNLLSFPDVQPSSSGTLDISVEKLDTYATLNFISLQWRTDRVLADASTLSVLENGTNTLGFRLEYDPGCACTVHVNRLSGDADLFVAGSGELVFNSANWSNWQSVAFAAAPDADASGGTAEFVCNGLRAAGTIVTLTELELEAFAAPVYVPEGRSRYIKIRPTAVLESAVTVTVSRVGGDADITLTGDTNLVFNPADGDVYQNIAVAAAEDADSMDGVTTVRCAAVGFPALDVIVNEADDDVAGLESAANPLFIPEAASSNLYVRLTASPLNVVTVTVTKAAGDADITVAGDSAEMIFNSGNWSNWQSVTISAAADGDAADGSATISVAGPGMTTLEVLAVEVDDESDNDVTTTVLLDIGSGSYETPGNWNNYDEVWKRSLYIVTDAIDTNGADTGIDMYLEDGFLNYDTSGIPGEELYPSNAVLDSGRFYGATYTSCVLRFEELPAEASGFIVKVFSSFDDTGLRRVRAAVDFSNVVLNACGNSTTQAVIEGIAPVDNSFDLGLQIYPGDTYGYVNVVELQWTVYGLRPVASPAPLVVPENGSNTLYVRLSQAVASATTVTVSKVSGDADLSIVGPTQLVFDASNWNVHQPVWITADNDLDPLAGEMTVFLALPLGGSTATVIEDDDDRPQSILIDFGSADLSTGNWNNVFAYQSNAVPIIANLVNENGDLSGLALYITNNFGGLGSSGSDYYRYPYKSTRDHLWVSPNAGEDNGGLMISNLQSNTAYTVLLYGYADFDHSDSYTEFEVEGSLQQLDNEDNTNNIAAFAIIPPPGDGQIDIRVSPVLGGNFRKCLNVMEILYEPAVAADTDVDELMVPEGDSADLGIQLTVEPISTRTVLITRVSGDADISLLAGEFLVFPPDTWDTRQYVTFSADEDSDDELGEAIYHIQLMGNAAVSFTVVEADDEAENVDQDGDGMPNDWEEEHGGGPTNLMPYADEDGDGHYNIEEWVAYTDPTNAQSYLMISETALESANDYYIIRWTSASNRNYSIRWGTNLFGVFSDLATGIPAVLPENAYTDDVHYTEDSIYYRIDVRMDEE